MSQGKEFYSSIFDAASKIGKKRASKGGLPLDSSQELEQEITPDQAPAGQKMGEEEMNARYDRCLELHNMIHDKLEKAFAERNMTVKKVREYFETAQHFSQNEWRLIQEQRDEVEKMLKKLVPKREGADVEKVKSKEQRPKSMQTKSRWLPMH